MHDLNPTPAAEPDWKALLQEIFDGVYYVDRDRRILFWNCGAERLTGYAASEMIGRHCHDNILNHINADGLRLCRSHCPLAHAMTDGVPRVADVFLHHKDGFRLPVNVRVSPIRDPAGNIVGAVEVFSDNSSKLAALDRIEHLVQENLHDPLTGVGNRRYTEITLQSRLDECRRFDRTCGLFFIDIDHFKLVNDEHGHCVGDRTLVAVARTLAGQARSFDFVGRFGGEEFVLIAPDMHALEDVWNLAERLRCIVGGIEVSGSTGVVRPTISVGATLAVPADSVDSAITRADALMYRAKEAGRNRVVVG